MKIKKAFARVVAFLLIAIMLVPTSAVKVKADSSTPMIGEIKLFAGNFAPVGWAFCNGQTLNISEYTSLYSIIGTTYGGDGTTTFALPNLNEKVAVGSGIGTSGTSYALGQTGGSSSVTLTSNQIPAHGHTLNLGVASSATGQLKASTGSGSTAVPGTSVLAKGIRNERIYSNATTSLVSMKNDIIEFSKTYTTTMSTATVGGNSSHDNMSPSLSLNYIIALNGIFTTSDSGGSGEDILGEIKMFAGDYVPKGYYACKGQLVNINTNQALFALLGTYYGGNGQTTFALPNLQGRIPLGAGQGPGLSDRVIGEMGGEEKNTLILNNIPAHAHGISAQTYNYNETASLKAATSKGNTASPEGNVLAKGSRNQKIYGTSGSTTMSSEGVSMTMSGSATATSSDSGYSTQSHENMMPYQTINYIICSQGIFPSNGGSSAGDNPFYGEIKMFAFNFTPSGYAACQGQLLSISQNAALFSLLGTYYGGNGSNNFMLPDLRGRTPLGADDEYPQGSLLGEERVTLTTANLPSHSHSYNVSTSITGTGTLKATTLKGNKALPGSNILAKGYKNERIYSTADPLQLINNIVNLNLSVTVSPVDGSGNAVATGYTGLAGGTQSHNNMQPYLVINYAIATSGIYPPRQ